MLSDVLAMAIQEMEEYQEEDDGYDGSRAQIEYVKAAMQRLVNYYSTPRNEDFCPTCGWCTWDCQCPEEVFWQGIDASIGRQVFHDLQERKVACELEKGTKGRAERLAAMAPVVRDLMTKQLHDITCQQT